MKVQKQEWNAEFVFLLSGTAETVMPFSKKEDMLSNLDTID